METGHRASSRSSDRCCSIPVQTDLGFVDQSHLSRGVRTATGERMRALRDRLGDR